MNSLPTLALSSFSRRLGAAIADFLLLLVPVMLLHSVIPVAGAFLVGILYYPIFESSRLQATLGKRWMGIQVVGLDGQRISFKTAVIRYAVETVSQLFLCLGHIFALFTDRKQAAHDLLADTMVVHGRNEASAADAWVGEFRAIFGSESTTQASTGGSSVAAELERLASLRDRGAISDIEYEAAKKRLLKESFL